MVYSMTPGAVYQRQYRRAHGQAPRNPPQSPEHKNGRAASRYAQDPEARRRKLAGQAEHRANVRAILAWLKSPPCMDCMSSWPPECMEFDHRPGTAKRINMGNLKSTDAEAIQDEAMKCDLVCSNCHRLRTSGRRRIMH